MDRRRRGRRPGDVGAAPGAAAAARRRAGSPATTRAGRRPTPTAASGTRRSWRCSTSPTPPGCRCPGGARPGAPVPLRPEPAPDVDRRASPTGCRCSPPRAPRRSCCRGAPGWPPPDGDRRPRRRRPARDRRRRSTTGPPQGLRVLAVAERDRRPPDAWPSLPRDEAEADLTLLGLVGHGRPAAPRGAGAVTRCHTAGIRLHRRHRRPRPHRQGGRPRGRHRHRADASWSPAPSWTPCPRRSSTSSWTGHEELVFARSSPEAKLRIADALQARGARGRDDRRRRQRRPGAAPGRHRRRHGPLGHRRGPRGRHHGAHRRQLRHHRQRGARPAAGSTTTSASSSSTSSPTRRPRSCRSCSTPSRAGGSRCR